MQVSSEALMPGLHTLDEFLVSGHKAVLGKTRSGKSKLIESWFYGTRLRGFFVNPHRVHIRAKLVRTPEEAIRLLAKGERRLQWQPPREHEVEGGKKEILRQYGAFVAALFDVGRRMFRGDKAAPWLLLVTDECQLLASKTGSIGPLEMVLTEGAKFGIVAVNASQRPARVSYEVTGQAAQTFVFRLEPEDLGALRDRRYPVDEFQPWLDQAYHFVVMVGERWAPFQPIKLTA